MKYSTILDGIFLFHTYVLFENDQIIERLSYTQGCFFFLASTVIIFLESN